MRSLINVTSLLSLNAVFDSSAPTHLPSSSTPDLSLYTPRTPLNETVSAKVRQTLARYHTAAFRELQVKSTFGPTTDPESLLNVRLLFSFASRGTLSVDMLGTWGQWSDVRLWSGPLPGGQNALPARLVMDIVFADELKRRAGYLGSYNNVVVAWPQGLRLGYDQPYYCFFMEGNQPEFVYVGVNDQIVLTSLPTLEDDGRSIS